VTWRETVVVRIVVVVECNVAVVDAEFVVDHEAKNTLVGVVVEFADSQKTPLREREREKKISDGFRNMT